MTHPLSLAPSRVLVAIAVTAVASSAFAATATASGTPSSTTSSTSSPSSSTSSAPSVDLTEPQTSSEGVEVSTYGTVQVRPYQKAENPLVTLAVHGVQRIETGTVVYFSVGSSEAAPIGQGLSELAGAQLGDRFTSGGSVGTVRLVDPETLTVLEMLPHPEKQDSVAATPFTSPLSAVPDEPGVMGVMAAVLPKLPAETETVDVQLVFGATVPGVPVGDGAFEPVVPGDEVIPLGTGWPQVDSEEVGRVQEPDLSVHGLAVVTEALDQSSVTTEDAEEVTIDLAADVLFAFDKADLSAAAQAKLAEVAAQVKERAAPGTLTIVGHTDSKGTDAYNNDLSKRRAQAVADALTPQIAGVELDITVEGRGESEPVADNSTDKGRQANRRVSVTYTIAGG